MKRFNHKKKPAGYSPFNFRFNIRNYINYSRFLIILTTILFTIGGTYYAFFHTPRYTATVVLSSQIYGSLSAAAISENKGIPLDDKETAAPRQLELIQTKQILRKLVNGLNLNLEKSGRNASLLRVETLEVPESLNNTPIVITPVDGRRFNIDIPSKEIAAGGVLRERETFSTPDGKAVTILISALPPEGSRVTLKKIPVGEAIDEFLANSLFEAPGVTEKLVTNLIRVSYTGMDPRKVTSVVNKLAEIAVEESKQEESKEARRALTLFEVERMQVLGYLNQTGKKLAELNRELDRVSLSEDVDSQFTADQLVEVEKSILKAAAELAMLEQNLTDKSPKLREAKAAYQSLIARRNAVAEQAKGSLKKGDELLDLQRDLLVYTNLYQEICNNLQQFEARVISPVGNLSILEYAEFPDTPVSFSRPVIILLSALIGLICGYIVALVLD